MRRKEYIKANQRFVMYIPNNLREEIERWVNKNGITLAEFGREAFQTYLSEKRREERNAQLAETCRLFNGNNEYVLNDWAGLENNTWPS